MAKPEFIAFVTTSGRRASFPAAQAAGLERVGWKREESEPAKAEAPRARRAKAKKDADAPAEDASED